MTGKPPIGSAPAAEAFADAHARLLADSTIQFELSPIEPRAQTQPTSTTAFEFLNSPAMTVIFWILVALLTLAIFYFLARRFGGWSPPWREEVGDQPGPELRPEESAARRLLDEADQLARQGRFSEAARLLLFRSLVDIDSRRPGLLRPALTSRDIAALTELPDRPREAFAGIAMIVERGLFAMRSLTRQDWDECRSAYERFAFVEGWNR